MFENKKQLSKFDFFKHYIIISIYWLGKFTHGHKSYHGHKFKFIVRVNTVFIDGNRFSDMTMYNNIYSIVRFNELYWYYIPYRSRYICIMLLPDNRYAYQNTSRYLVKYMFRKNKKTLYRVIKKSHIDKQLYLCNNIWKFYTDGTIVKDTKLAPS